MHKTSFSITAVLILCTIVISLGCDRPQLEKRDCVVMLGDSIFALSDEETQFLEELSGVSYRHYYVSGAEMEGGLVTSIPEQYEKAIRDGAVRTVIMNGGGNDVLISGRKECSTPYGTPLSEDCLDIIDDVKAASEAMLLKMAADGVRNIIWQGYYHSKNSNFWQVSEYTNTVTKQGLVEFQATFPHMKVIFVDIQPYFNKYQSSQYTIFDGIHPTAKTSEKLANLVWDAMLANDIEQGTSCD